MISKILGSISSKYIGLVGSYIDNKRNKIGVLDWLHYILYSIIVSGIQFFFLALNNI